jgi:hypothetical protein
VTTTKTHSQSSSLLCLRSRCLAALLATEIPPLLHCLLVVSFWRVESYVTTDGQSASVSWNKAPTWGLRSDLYYCQRVASLLMWDALSDERTGLSFKTAAGPRQRSHCLRIETSLFAATYVSQGYGGGIRPRLHMVLSFCSQVVRAM